MQLIGNLPPAFDRYKAAHGVLSFEIFEGAAGGADEHVRAIKHAFRAVQDFDIEVLRSLGSRRIDRAEFYGSCYEPETGRLIARGTKTTSIGLVLEDPPLKTSDDVIFVSSAGFIPAAGSGGEFAYAFSETPYGLSASPGEIQAMFDEIRNFILPSEGRTEIFDWSSPRLREVSSYFEAGLEWWGVFLFSIYNLDFKRLTVVAGSTTD